MRVGDEVPEALSRATALDAQGREIALRSLWAEGPCLLVFLRHFGCPGCGEQMADLVPRVPELRAAGVRVAVIGSGSIEQLAAFRAREKLEERDLVTLTDPSLAAYRAAGLLRSAWGTLGPHALFAAARAMLRGHPHRLTQGDNLQQGGALLVDDRGRVAFHHRNESLGDRAPAVDLVDAALSLLARRSALLV